MKIRMKDNSIRFRLTKSEVTSFCDKGFYKSETQLVNKSLIYILNSSEDVDNLTASFQENTISVIMPNSLKEEWSNSDKVGFKNEVQLPNGVSLLIKVEKDFVCLDETEEDQSDNYPNPRS